MSKIISVFGSARLSEDSVYCKECFSLCDKLAKLGYGIKTGGGGGIMQAANKAAYLNNVESIGINIKLPHEQKLNEYCTKSYLFTDLSLRKQELLKDVQAVIVCAGGYGTLDELFEILTLSQTKLKTMKIILFNKEFFSPLIDFFKNTLLKHNLIDNESLKIFTLCDNEEEVLKYLHL